MECRFRCCQSCKAPCAGDFKKVVDLQHSGLVIYIHTKKDEQKKAGASKYGSSYILHNTGSKQITRPDFIGELHRLKTKCGQCKTIVQQVRSLLNEIKDIRENEVIGVCEHCKQASLMKAPCKRCNFVVSKFLSMHQKRREEKQQRFKVWLCNVKKLLQAILDGESVCQHRVCKDTDLERILHELKEPLGMREPDIDFFPSLDQEQLTSFQSLSESKVMLEELLCKIKHKGDTRISSENSLYPSPSKEMCLCKYLKEGHFEGKISGLGPGKLTDSNDTMLSGEPIKDLSRYLSQDLYKSIIERLLQLSKALPQGLYANKELIQEILESLNTVLNKGLSTNMIIKLIKELKDLNKTLPQNISKELNKDVIQELITDLNDLLIIGSSKNLNNDLIQLLVDLSDLLTHELSKNINKKEPSSPRKELYEALPISSDDLTKAVSKKKPKEGLKLSPQIPTREISQGPPKSQSKIVRQGSPKSGRQDIEVFPDRKSEEGFQDLPTGQHKDDTQVLPTVQSKKSIQGLSKDKSKHSTHALPREQSEDGGQDLSKGLSKKSMQGLLKAQSKQSTHGLHRAKSERSTHAVLNDETKEGEQELSKGKKSMQGLPKAESKHSAHGLHRAKSERSTHATLSDETKEGEQELSKGQSKKSMQALHKAQSKQSTPGLLKAHSQHGSQATPEKIGDIEHKMSRQQIKRSMLALPKVQSKVDREIRDKGESKSQIKDGKRSLTSVHSKDDTQGLHRDQSTDGKRSLASIESKDGTQNLSKASTKDVVQELQKKKSSEKDLPRSPRKDIGQDTSTTSHKEMQKSSPKSQIKLASSLSRTLAKRSMLRATSRVSHKDLIKTQKDIKPESPTSKISSIDTSNPLVQKLVDLNKALSSGVIDKRLIQDLTRDINETLGQKSSDLLNKITQELIKLCKPAIQGIPKTSNMKEVQGLISDASQALDQGLSKDQNKKTVQSLLINLNKALSTKEKQELSKELKRGISKDKSKVLSPRYLKPPTKRDLSKRLLKGKGVQETKQGDLDKGTDTEEEDNRKLEIKTEKKPAVGAESAPGEEASHKKVLISRKSPTRKSLESDGTSKKLSKKPSEEDRMSRKTRLEIASQRGKAKFKFGDKDDSFDTETEKGLKKKDEKSKKGKENKLPVEAKKSQELKSRSKQKLSAYQIRKAKQLSEAVLLRLLSSNRVNAAKYHLYKQQQQAKEKEMERRRLKELALKNIPPPKEKKVITPPSTPEDTTSSILQCGIKRPRHPKAMIRGETIIPYDPHYKDHKDSERRKEPDPMLFKTQFKFADDAMITHKSEYEPGIDYEAMFKDGIVRYRLSSREFIDNGWTVLPTKKIMRRMNIYRMEPANPQHDWFERHKHDKELFYDSGQKLADIDMNGRGHWYYRNGTVALDYYNAKESNIGQRYVVYSSGTEMEECGKIKPRTILALFDVLGNGVIYDHYGNVRLKYNQSEGLLVDPKLGPPGKWKWHTLNDPPVLQQVFVNTCLNERDHKLDRVPKPDRGQDATEVTKQIHPEMLAIELDNFVKEKTSKLMRKFKPFQIRMKAVKLNEQFSLKIVDQASITLLFRDGATSLKLNLGMLLISDEIIDTDTSDMAEVSTPYDRHPAKTHSVENIQKILKTVRAGKHRPPSELTVQSSI